MLLAPPQLVPDSRSQAAIEWTSPRGERLTALPWKGHEGIERVLPAWRELDDAGAVDPLCNSAEWNASYAQTFVPSKDCFGWLLRRPSGETAAMLPFRMGPSGPLGSLPRALFLSDGSFDSDYLDFPRRGLSGSDVAAAALDLLGAARGVQAVVLTGVPEGSETLVALREELERRRLPRREARVDCLAMEVPADFESYLRGLKPRMRSKVRQALRAAEAAEARYLWCDDPAALASHLEGLYSLHTMRWQAEGKAGSFADPCRRALYGSLAPRWLASGKLRFGRVEIAGRPVAYQIGAIAGDTYYQLQEGFHTDFGKERVGTALRAWMIGELQRSGVRRYDFMAGASRHKEDWGGRPRPCVALGFALPRLRARLAYGVRTVLDRWRRAAPEGAPLPDDAGEESPNPKREDPA